MPQRANLDIQEHNPLAPCRHITCKCLLLAWFLEERSDCELINIDKIGLGANPANLQDIENEKRYTFIKGDICNPQLLNRIVSRVDTVVNIAAETHVDRSIADPYTFLQNNTIGTFTLLESLRRHNNKAKLVQVSTDEVYGQALEGSFKESQQPNPSNPLFSIKSRRRHVRAILLQNLWTKRMHNKVHKQLRTIPTSREAHLIEFFLA